MYFVAGVLALVVMFRAFGWKKTDSGEASPTGALKEVAQHTFDRSGPKPLMHCP